MSIVYLNGEFREESQAHISIDDRGFLFADGVYEVVHVYNGRPFEWNRHMDRLDRSLNAVKISPVSRDELVRARDRLLRDTSSREASLYIQITRGTQRRIHTPPAPGILTPTILMWVRPVEPIDPQMVARGVAVITVSDDRWAKVWVKTIGLLPNVLARGQAADRGVYDAIFVRDGMVMEGTSANIFRVKQHVLQTAPVTNYILPGITRAVIIEIAQEQGYRVLEEPFTVDELYQSDEVFLSGTSTEVLAVTEVDGKQISDAAGPMTQSLLALFHERAQRP